MFSAPLQRLALSSALSSHPLLRPSLVRLLLKERPTLRPTGTLTQDWVLCSFFCNCSHHSKQDLNPYRLSKRMAEEAGKKTSPSLNMVLILYISNQLGILSRNTKLKAVKWMLSQFCLASFLARLSPAGQVSIKRVPVVDSHTTPPPQNTTQTLQASRP